MALSNIGLDKGLRGPKKIAEQRFLSMLRSTEPINIKGVETYIKWKTAKDVSGGDKLVHGSGGI